MTFNSAEYLLFLPLVFGAYWTLRGPARNWLLLAASYLFYGWWDARFLILIVISTVVDFTIGRQLARRTDPTDRRRLLTASLVLNLGILAVFKYYDFFVDSAVVALDSMGWSVSAPFLRVALPVGISFYTFQTMSYTIDIYRGRMRHTDDPLVFATFVAFFPQLVAGPIERASRLIPQLANHKRMPSADDLATGVGLIILGLFQKVALADVVAPIADTGFENAESLASISVAIAVVAFGVQIYGDFAGYSNIARGSARLLGVELMHNFSEPYLSRDITEFWRRWHISLSSWLRDYLYISLGGNRRGRAKTYRNLMLTMLLGGLWHGAGWNFVIWGGLHGLFLATHRLASGGGRPAPGDAISFRDVPKVLATFVAVSFAWVFFRAQSAGEAWDVISSILAMSNVGASLTLDDLLISSYAVTATVLLDLVLRRRATVRAHIERHPVLSGAVSGLFILGILTFSGGPQVEFIYFQF